MKAPDCLTPAHVGNGSKEEKVHHWRSLENVERKIKTSPVVPGGVMVWILSLIN
jgi:hypothetical protein